MIYLNNAASSFPKAPGVIEAIANVLHEPPSHPGRSTYASDDPMRECRERISILLGINDPARIVLTSNSTQALNIAILGVGLKSGSRVITTVTEHNSVLRPLNHIKERTGIDIVYIGLDESGRLNIEEFEKEIKSGAELVVINHISNVTGRINDVGTLFAMSKASGAINLLDASQSLGHISFTAHEIYADLIAFTGHKGLHGPPGTGGLYVAPHIDLDQIFVGGTGVRSDLALHPPDMPTRLEAGTQNTPAFAGLAAALRWHEKEGKSFRGIEYRLYNILRNEFKNLPEIRVFDDTDNQTHIPVLSFKIKGLEVEETGYVLEESFGIICRTGLHCAPLIHKEIGSAPEGTVRFSLSGFNTESEINETIQAVYRIINHLR